RREGAGHRPGGAEGRERRQTQTRRLVLGEDGRDAELAGQFGQGDERGGLVAVEAAVEVQGGIVGVGARPGGVAVVGDPTGGGGVCHDRFPSLRRVATSAV